MAKETNSDNMGIIQVTVLPESTKVEPKVETTESHTLMLRADGTVWSYGSNTYGELGINSNVSTDEPTQVEFPEGTVIVDIAAGEFHSMALDENGYVWTWGRNNYYHLGETNLSYRKKPAKLNGVE